MLVSSPDPVIDANLAVALDALLAEHSVTRAAARLHTSPAAMSRTLARLRRILQDPLLVRAGQAMVPTPHAPRPCARRPPRWYAASERCSAPARASTPPACSGTFTLQAADLVGAALAPGLLRLARREAPGVSLRIRAEELEAGPGAARRPDRPGDRVHRPRGPRDPGRRTGHASEWWRPSGPATRSPKGR